MQATDHYRLDAAKYERHLAQFRANADRVGQLLEAIGSLARATRAVREAAEDGRVPADELNTLEIMVKLIAEQTAPDALHRPEPTVEVDEGLLDESIDLLLKNFQLMRFVSAHHRHRPRGADGGRPGRVSPCGRYVAGLA